MDRLDRYAPLSGVLVFVLFSAGNALWAIDVPATDASGDELVDFYEDRAGRIIAGASISLVSILIFAWFGAVLRERLEHLAAGRGAGLPLAAFGGVLLACATGLGAETINMAGGLRADSDGGITPDAAQSYFDISQVLGFNAAGVGLAVILAATAVISLRTRALIPRWLAVVMLVLSLTLLSPPLVRVSFMLVFLLLPLISIQLYRTEVPDRAA